MSICKIVITKCFLILYMMAEIDVDIFSESSSDEELLDYINILHRRPYIIRQRPNHLEYWDDTDFVNRFRLSKGTVQHLVEIIDNNIRFPTNRNSAITPLQQLIICLRFYASGNMLISNGDFGGVHKSSVCNILKRVTNALCTLRRRYLILPEGDENLVVQQGFYNIAAFPRALLALDCTHIKIQSPGGEQAELFRNRKGYFSLNVQAACDHRLKFRDIVARWPGATHDSTIFNNSFLKAKFEEGVGNKLILGDSGYPNLNYLMTPLLNPTTPAERAYNESQIRTRNVIERAFGVWKRRFPVLSLGLRVKLETVQDIIIATAILHNIAIDRNEPEFAIDPELEQFINENVPLDNIDVHVNNSVRNELIHNYFSRLQ